MKYREFRQYLELNEIRIREDEERLIVGLNYIQISKVEEHSIIFSIVSVEDIKELELIKKAVELAETPLIERVWKKGDLKMKKQDILNLNKRILNDEQFRMIKESEIVTGLVSDGFSDEYPGCVVYRVTIEDETEIEVYPYYRNNKL